MKEINEKNKSIEYKNGVYILCPERTDAYWNADGRCLYEQYILRKEYPQIRSDTILGYFDTLEEADEAAKKAEKIRNTFTEDELYDYEDGLLIIE